MNNLEKIINFIKDHPKKNIVGFLILIYVSIYVINIGGHKEKDFIVDNTNTGTNVNINTKNPLADMKTLSGSIDLLSNKILSIINESNKQNKNTVMSFINGVDCSKPSNMVSGFGLMSYDCIITDSNLFIKSIQYIDNFLTTKNEFGNAYYFSNSKSVNISNIDNKTVIFKITGNDNQGKDPYFLLSKEQSYIFTQKGKLSFGKTFLSGSFSNISDFSKIFETYKAKYPDLKKIRESNTSITYSTVLGKGYINDFGHSGLYGASDKLDNLSSLNANLISDQTGIFYINDKIYRVFIYFDNSKLLVHQDNTSKLSYLRFMLKEALVGGIIINDDDGELIFLDKSNF